MENRASSTETDSAAQAAKSPNSEAQPGRDGNRRWWRDRRLVAFLGAIAAFVPPLTVAASAMITGYWESAIQRQRQEHEIVTSYLDRAIDEDRNGESRRQVLRFINYSQTGGLQAWAAAELVDLDSAREQRIRELEQELAACTRPTSGAPAVAAEPTPSVTTTLPANAPDPSGDVDALQSTLDRLAKQIEFVPGRSSLLPSSFPALDEAAALLKDHPTLQLRVEGHYDDRALDNANLLISRDRARTTVDYLVMRGIDRGRLSPVAKGKSSPVASNLTEEGRRTNRRVELKIVR